MKIPGITAQHAIISDDCRQERGDDGAIEAALDRIRHCYKDLLKFWPVGREAKFHVAMSIDYTKRIGRIDG